MNTFAYAQTVFTSAVAKCSALGAKIEAIKKNIQVQEDSVNVNSTPIEDNSTYKYYKTQIDETRARKDAALEKLEQEFRQRRDTLESKYDAQINMFTLNLESTREKIENKTPTTPAYRRLIAELNIVEKQLVESKQEHANALATLEQAFLVDAAKKKKDALEKERVAARQRQIENEEAGKRIEQDRENTRKAEMERAKQRSEAAKIQTTTIEESNLQFAFTPPPKKIKKAKGEVKKLSFPLDPKKQYTVDELDTIDVDYEKDGDANCELYDKLYHEAAIREGMYGAWECKEESLSPV